MSSTNFQSGTVIASTWLNDVNNATYNGLSPSNSPGSSVTQYSQGSTNAVARSVQSKLQDMVSVFDFMTTAQITAVQSGNSGNVDCTTPLQNAINYCAPLGKILFCPAGTYYITTTLVKTGAFYGLNLMGENYGTIFNYPSISSGTSCVQIVGGSGGLCNCVIQGITFKGSSTSIGVEICGQDGQIIRDCNFYSNAIGLWFHNRDSGSFTEYCVADNCAFISPCLTAVQYSVGSGNNSFNGSGIRNCQINSSGSNSNPVIIVGNGSLPYNAPLSAQIWGGGILIRNDNNNINNCNWYGHITIENGGTPALTLGVNTYSSGRLAYAGTISSLGQYFTPGALVLYNNYVTVTNGANSGYPQPTYSNTASVTTGGLVPLKAISAPCIACITLIGANYEYAYCFFFTRLAGISPYLFFTQLANPLAFNQSGWGGATFSITGAEYNESLVVTNASSGFNVSVAIQAVQIGWTIPDGTGTY